MPGEITSLLQVACHLRLSSSFKAQRSLYCSASVTSSFIVGSTSQCVISIFPLLFESFTFVASPSIVRPSVQASQSTAPLFVICLIWSLIARMIISSARQMFVKNPRMGSTENKSIYDMRENILLIFKDFMTGITKIDELGTAGSRLLIGFQQALEFFRRPPIDGTSELTDKIIQANETKRVKMYIEAGCRNPLDGVQNVNKTEFILKELEGLLVDVTNSTQSTDGNLLPISDLDSAVELNDHAAYNDMEEMALSNSQNIDVIQLAALMGIIYSMVKQDYLMQEKIVSALNLKSSSGELESYCLMWSLRPFINDDIMHQAWRLIS